MVRQGDSSCIAKLLPKPIIKISREEHSVPAFAPLFKREPCPALVKRTILLLLNAPATAIFIIISMFFKAYSSSEEDDWPCKNSDFESN